VVPSVVRASVGGRRRPARFEGARGSWPEPALDDGDGEGIEGEAAAGGCRVAGEARAAVEGERDAGVREGVGAEGGVGRVGEAGAGEAGDDDDDGRVALLAGEGDRGGARRCR
jgi:hypothetical protein